MISYLDTELDDSIDVDNLRTLTDNEDTSTHTIFQHRVTSNVANIIKLK